MTSSTIWVYSKKDGVSQFLFITENKGDVLSVLKEVIEEKFKEHQPFVYILVQGKEIKLF